MPCVTPTKLLKILKLCRRVTASGNIDLGSFHWKKKNRQIKKSFVIINCNPQSITVLESRKCKGLFQLPNNYNNLENEY